MGPIPLRPPTVAVLVVGLLITGLLSWLAYVANSRNEARLLKAQVRQAGALLQAVVPTVQTPLAAAAEIAASGTAGTERFADYMAGYVGTGKPFVSAQLWRTADGAPQVIASAGRPTELPVPSSRAASLAATAQRSHQLALVGPVGAYPGRLGYAYAASRSGPDYVVYAEGALPPRRRATITSSSPFANLRFALYLGNRPSADRLLEANVDLPMHDRTATVRVPFGGTSLTLVARSSNPLGGTVSSAFWWIIALAGVALTATGALSAQRLVARREAAEQLTGEVRTLLGKQRTIAEALQHALLPSRLPQVPAMEITARYVPGTDGVQIGGDWYDVVPLDGDRVFFVVGDVSGRGLEAGSLMASLLFASRGFVSEGHSPERVLDALTKLLDIEQHKHFATVLCGVVDPLTHTLTVANAGHLTPLVVSNERTEFVAVPTGPPIGVPHADGYAAVTVPVPRDATLLAFTDGLVERRGETLDDGLRRLMDVVTSAGTEGEALVEDVMTALLPDGCDDDTAILALRWRQ